MLQQLRIDEWRLLTFRQPSRALQERWPLYLAFGLLFTWLAGVGRYWDNPKAHLWQTLGLGSVIYVFVLALIIWLLLAPMRPANWTYRNLLLFITLTAPPAVLYATPVERFLSIDAAMSANALFLAVVALWRVLLYGVFLHRVARLSAGTLVIGTLLPLVVIVVALTALNLEHVVFQLMSGIHDRQPPGPNDSAYRVVIFLSVVSVVASPILLIGYAVSIYMAWRGPDAGRP